MRSRGNWKQSRGIFAAGAAAVAGVVTATGMAFCKEEELKSCCGGKSTTTEIPLTFSKDNTFGDLPHQQRMEK